MSNAIQAALTAFRDGLIKTETLPASGLTVKLKPVSIFDLAAGGTIPDAMRQFLGGEKESGKTAVEWEKIPELVATFDGVAASSLIAAVIEGVDVPFAAVGDDSHIGVNELPFPDKLFIFELGNDGIDAVKPFRGKQK